MTKLLQNGAMAPTATSFQDMQSVNTTLPQQMSEDALAEHEVINDAREALSSLHDSAGTKDAADAAQCRIWR